MSDPWFNENLFGGILGSVFGVSAGLWGALAGALAPRGRARGLVIGGAWAFLLASMVLLVLGLVALVSGQPYGVWYGLTLAGGIGLIVFGVNLPNLYRVYRAAEERKLAASDLTDGDGEKATAHVGDTDFRAD